MNGHQRVGFVRLVPGGVAPICGGDGPFNVTDLNLVIALWGDCPSGVGGESIVSPPNGGDAELRSRIADCMAAAEENGLEGSKYAEFMMECILGLLYD